MYCIYIDIYLPLEDTQRVAQARMKSILQPISIIFCSSFDICNDPVRCTCKWYDEDILYVFIDICNG